MDNWLWAFNKDPWILECPVCERVWRLRDRYAASDMRHCPWCGERLEPPKEETK